MSPLGGVYEAAVERMPDARVRWRALGMLYFAGGTLAALALALPHPEVVMEGLIAAIAGVAITIGLVMLFAPPLQQTHWVFAMLCLGAALISLAMWGARSQSGPYAFFYVWVAFEACFFLPMGAAVAAVVIAGLMYAAALLAIHDGVPGAAGQWLIAMGTTAVVGVLAALLRERSDRLISQLGDAARTDPLTGLLNRRGFQEFLADHQDRPLSLIVADLDHFKALNDRFGHQAGDQVLRRCGGLLSRSAPPGAAAARTGGEEFAIVLPDCDAAEASKLAEALRRAVRESIAPGGRGLTMSFGVASAPEHAETNEDLIKAADRALYHAKHLGRDRTVVFSWEAHAAGERRASEDGGGQQAAAVLVLAEALDLRDGGTAAHSRTVGRLSEIVARQLGFRETAVERVRLAGVLHDIGKLGVRDDILRKPGRLTAAEEQEIRRHPELGARILLGAGLDDVASWVIAHHERMDGHGYPFALTGSSIPLEARILAAADAYEAMVADRVYRRARSHAQAAAELRRSAGTQFDADVVQALLIALELPEQGVRDETGYVPVS